MIEPMCLATAASLTTRVAAIAVQVADRRAAGGVERLGGVGLLHVLAEHHHRQPRVLRPQRHRRPQPLVGEPGRHPYVGDHQVGGLGGDGAGCWWPYRRCSGSRKGSPTTSTWRSRYASPGRCWGPTGRVTHAAEHGVARISYGGHQWSAESGKWTATRTAGNTVTAEFTAREG